MERQPPPTFTGRCTQPKPHQVSSRHAALGRVVSVLCPRVQNVGVGHELNIAHLQDHVQFDAIAHRLERFEGVDLLGAQGRDDALVAEPRQAAHVVRVPFTVDPLLGGRVRLVGRFEVDDARANVGLFALADFALAVKVPHWLCQQLRHVRVL